jgi:hypothetical protein
MTFLRPSRCSHRALVHELPRFTFLSCSWIASRVCPEPSCHEPLPTSPRTVSRSWIRWWQYRHGPPMEFLTLRRHQIREATYTGCTLPSCAASSGFLSLSTPSSARLFPVLFHTGTTQVSVFRGFPSPLASCALRRALSLMSFSVDSLRSQRCHSRDCCIREVRSACSSVTRCLAADPLLTFTPSRSSSLGLGALAGASSHGLQHAAGYEPKSLPFVVLALQSFKEPRE